MIRSYRQMVIGGLISGLLGAGSTAPAAEPLSIRIAMPALVCNKGVLEPNECILNGILRARGPESLNGPQPFYCDLRYSYVAAGSEQQAIRFIDRTLFHGSVALRQGRGTQDMTQPLTLKLSGQARQIEVLELSCEPEQKKP